MSRSEENRGDAPVGSIIKPDGIEATAMINLRRVRFGPEVKSQDCADFTNRRRF